MINGIHGMFYSSEPEALREFLRDKLGLPAKDVGHGWLIYDFTQADMGVHPTLPPMGDPGGPPSGTHSVSFTCADIAKTVEELKGRGVEFATEIEDRGYGLVIELEMPGGVRIDLYEPRY
ncbi:Glyoxalase-like domain protein [Planctomycetes bacterium Pla163]|uniref:Glyoxalase-like domain protein n=1 Tax=Rohdeia mirabilis TaxID=2528008 RepID=A0A518CVE4_9BACT|nr:Glyoxalase-like domain protein [Planctomycetes bacterium Pla163]